MGKQELLRSLDAEIETLLVKMQCPILRVGPYQDAGPGKVEKFPDFTVPRKVE
jgi:hypothetical protein